MCAMLESDNPRNPAECLRIKSSAKHATLPTAGPKWEPKHMTPLTSPPPPSDKPRPERKTDLCQRRAARRGRRQCGPKRGFPEKISEKTSAPKSAMQPRKLPSQGSRFKTRRKRNAQPSHPHSPCGVAYRSPCQAKKETASLNIAHKLDNCILIIFGQSGKYAWRWIF